MVSNLPLPVVTSYGDHRVCQSRLSQTFVPQSLEICLNFGLPSIGELLFAGFFIFFRLIDQLWVHLSISLNNYISNGEETNGQMIRVSQCFHSISGGWTHYAPLLPFRRHCECRFQNAGCAISIRLAFMPSVCHFKSLFLVFRQPAR